MEVDNEQSEKSSDEDDNPNDEDYVNEDNDEEDNEDEELVDTVQPEVNVRTSSNKDNETYQHMKDERFWYRCDLEKYIRDYYGSKGVLLKIGQHSDRGRLSMKCLSGNKYHNHGGGICEKRTRLTDCPFEVKGTYHSRLDQWRVIKVNESHNHPVSQSYFEYRRFKESEIMLIRAAANMGSTAAAIMLQLQDASGNTKATMKDINNEIQRFRNEYLCGRTPIIALRDALNVENFMFNFEMCPETNKVKSLFFAPHQSAVLARWYNTCFIMDCTYKTNRFGMPLFSIVGFTASYRTFNVGFVFLLNKFESNYVWALNEFIKITEPKVISTDRELALMNAITKVFPNTTNLLCIWHINKNIMANCKKRFTDEESWNKFVKIWNECCFSATEELFEFNWERLVVVGDAISIWYVEDTWLPHKTKFLHFYCNNVQHMGSTATSRAEGSHRVIKKFISNANGDLLMVKQRLSLMRRQQLQNIITDLEQNRIRVKPKHRECIRFIHRHRQICK